MDDYKCCVEITVSASGTDNIKTSEKGKYINEKYQIAEIPMTDMYFSNKGDDTHFIITYSTYYEEPISYHYYDFIRDKKKELQQNITMCLNKMSLNIDDIEINIF